ncbi:hypothetical protein PDE_00227 [Penicillium oxalicum 114-2]|uniref:Uncharacterized protein n=1 Tax=Penicillium oxalicum (strain 114-2 / CGMCC 5302) TaxID=933388 RepID=S7Z5B0_PENO1|nr:hypothetical protein PDE_00227 [Penicillium oxalicum 114-2]
MSKELSQNQALVANSEYKARNIPPSRIRGPVSTWTCRPASARSICYLSWDFSFPSSRSAFGGQVNKFSARLQDSSRTHYNLGEIELLDLPIRGAGIDIDHVV